MDPQAMLEQLLAEKAADWDEGDRITVRAIAVDLTTLAAREVAGEDVVSEFMITKASAANVAAAAVVTGAKVVETFIANLMTTALNRLLGLPG